MVYVVKLYNFIQGNPDIWPIYTGLYAHFPRTPSIASTYQSNIAGVSFFEVEVKIDQYSEF